MEEQTTIQDSRLRQGKNLYVVRWSAGPDPRLLHCTAEDRVPPRVQSRVANPNQLPLINLNKAGHSHQKTHLPRTHTARSTSVHAVAARRADLVTTHTPASRPWLQQ